VAARRSVMTRGGGGVSKTSAMAALMLLKSPLG